MANNHEKVPVQTDISTSIHPQDDAERLRTLLLGRSANTLDELEHRVGDPQQRANDVAEVLARAGHIASNENKKAFSNSLKVPVNSAIKSNIQENAQEFADLLYPSILPSIRRAISEYMRQFSERVDRLMKQRYSVQSIKWRYEAFRSGIPLKEMIVRKTLNYRIEQILLINNESGLLMQHVHLNDISPADSDATSGMLWAIQSFVRDSITHDSDSDLDRVTMGDHLVYLFRGPHATLAAVSFGVPPEEYFERTHVALEQIHAQNGEQIQNFQGDKKELQSSHFALTECLEADYIDKEESDAQKEKLSKRIKWISFLVGALLLTWLAFSVSNAIEKRKVDALVSQLNDEPGIQIHSSTKKDSTWHLDGLIDPLATSPQNILSESDLSAEQVQFKLTPFLSLEEALLTKRARKILQPPNEVQLALDGEHLQLSGQSTAHWYVAIQNPNSYQGLSFSGIDVDLSQLSVQPQSVVTYLHSKNTIPNQIQTTLTKNSIIFSGQLSQQEKSILESSLAPFEEAVTIDMRDLKLGTDQKLNTLIRTLESLNVYFTSNVTLRADATDTLIQATTVLRQILQQAHMLNRSASIQIFGDTDSGGTLEKNNTIRQARALFVKQFLINSGIPVSLLSVSESPVTPSGIHERRAYFLVNIIQR